MHLPQLPSTGPSQTVAAAIGLAALLQASAMAAGCSRAILVPAAAATPTVTVTNGEIGGMIPEMLRTIGAQSGCTFEWTIVPRIRLEKMFELGRADLLVAATRVERRDRFGVFVPIVEARPMLISVNSKRAPVRSMAELMARRELRLALVRGYDYGAPYQELIKTAEAQRRLYLSPDITTVARRLAANMADVTIMPAGTFIGVLQGDARIEGLSNKLRLEPMDELPWIATGIYLSRKSLNAADRALLERAIAASVKSGAWWQALNKYYPPSVLHNNARPLDAGRSTPP